MPWEIDRLSLSDFERCVALINAMRDQSKGDSGGE